MSTWWFNNEKINKNVMDQTKKKALVLPVELNYACAASFCCFYEGRKKEKGKGKAGWPKDPRLRKEDRTHSSLWQDSLASTAQHRTAAHCLWLLGREHFWAGEPMPPCRDVGTAKKILTFKPVWIITCWPPWQRTPPGHGRRLISQEVIFKWRPFALYLWWIQP